MKALDILAQLEVNRSLNKFEFDELKNLIKREVEARRKAQAKLHSKTSQIAAYKEKVKYWKVRAERLEC